MLSLHKKRRIALSVIVMAAIVVPATVFAVSEIAKTADTSAVVNCNPSATNISGAVCLQDMNDNVKTSMTAETQYTLKDSRDGKSYYVSKLKDGNVWMTQNLDLGSSSSTTALSAMDTDISASSTFTSLPKAELCADYDCARSYADIAIHQDGNGVIDYGDSKYSISQWNAVSVDDYMNSINKDPNSDQAYYSTLDGKTNSISSSGNAHYKVGNDYLFEIARAGSGGSSNVTNAADSICPAGWRLPSEDIYNGLVSKYTVEQNKSLYINGVTYITTVDLTSLLARRNPTYFIGGNLLYDGSKSGGKNDIGNYVVSDNKSSVFSIGNSIYHGPGSIGAFGTYAGNDPAYVRCVARPDSSFTYTLSYNVNGGTGSVASNTIKSSHKQVNATVSNTKPTRTNYTFMGWAESSSANTAKYSGGDVLALSGNKTLYAVWKIALPDQTVSFAEASVTKTYGDAKFINAATTNGDGAITYSSDNANVATVNSNSGEVTIVGAGTTTITAIVAATSSYNEASATYTLTVNKANRTVSFNSNSINKTYGDAQFTNTAAKTGDGTIVYSSNNTNVAEINSSTGKVTIKGVGTATVTASVAATNNYNAGEASYTLTVAKATPNISFANSAISKVYGDTKFTNAATTNSNGTITYSSNNTTVATINSTSGEVAIKGAGTAIITASVAATSNYNEASATYTLTVSSHATEISFANTTVTKTYGDAKFTNAATTTSDGTITYSSNNTTVATINSTSGEVTIKGAGTATITANVSATSNYNAASTTYTLTVNKKASTTPSEISEVKAGYVNDTLSTIALNTNGLVWKNANTKIKEGLNGYQVSYTENGDSNNYTTETYEITVNGEHRIYVVIEGDEQKYVIEDGGYASFRINADFGLFGDNGAVYIDGVLLDPQYYVVESGSTIINVSDDYLRTLSTGEHTLVAHFSDGGVATAHFTITEVDGGGDETPGGDGTQGEDGAPGEEGSGDKNGIIAVPNTGDTTASFDNVNVAYGILFAVLMVATGIGLYCYRNKKAHRKFEW